MYWLNEPYLRLVKEELLIYYKNKEYGIKLDFNEELNNSLKQQISKMH